jgi:mono/diheme cytochrome c family protein
LTLKTGPLLLAVLAVVAVLAAQTQTATPPAQHHHPDPKNLQALPKTLNGDRLDEIMDAWSAELGVHCNACHTIDPKHPRPDGRPGMDFADDSKPEKATARQMVRMTDEINRNYIAKIENSGQPVTCGTCHRGHLGPEPFALPTEEPHAPALAAK